MEITATISSFLTHVRVEKGLSSNTVSAYRRDLVKFDEFARKRKLSLEAVSRDDLVDFLAGLYRQKLESKTVARELVTLRNFFRFAQIQDLIPEDPSVNLESPKIRRNLPGYLRLEEVERLLNQPDVKTPIGLRRIFGDSRFTEGSSGIRSWIWAKRKKLRRVTRWRATVLLSSF